MADALGLDSTYLSQLENGRREVDEWYLKRATEFEKSNEVNPLHDADFKPSAEACMAYLKSFLETCNDPAKIGWTYIELREHFPMNKWTPKRGQIGHGDLRRGNRINSEKKNPAERIVDVVEEAAREGGDVQ